MENPKIRRIRRHASLRAHLNSRPESISRRHTLKNSKSNPYVGWFRHAPCTTFNKSTCTIFDEIQRQKKSLQMKRSPYVGWFCHSPPSSSRLQKRLFVQFQNDLERLIALDEARQRKVIDGKLRGGSPSWEETCESVKRTLDETSIESPSTTVRALSRLATWFLFPSYDDYSGNFSKKCDGHLFHCDCSTGNDAAAPAESDDDCSTDDDGDDSDDNSILTIGTYIRHHVQHQESDVCVSPESTISSLAAAYHAHQAGEELERTFQEDFHITESDHDDERLDYVITQVDIARMAKNASRHLDVQSILSLPIITYDAEGADHSDKGQETGSSWMIVPPIEHDVQKAGQVCVICLENFCTGDRLRVLPCCHSFHVGCIDRWLSGSHSFYDCDTSGCPTCKKRPEDGGIADERAHSSGFVPSWAFASVGDALANSTSM
eukprot:CAMPEP_0194217194 /NCGR_PEP_ID=MMETSP0156-20130528/20587_1 /TAXON_ID=33649 /ORGANISM="Thalassionema nitzschioides, Strain L26-B" /LENGTH=433 /DNA_ID=CAMNT_0038946171 /DNA_START=29 /DNA_END=1330 /DNA_ORIENTATION=-